MQAGLVACLPFATLPFRLQTVSNFLIGSVQTTANISLTETRAQILATLCTMGTLSVVRSDCVAERPLPSGAAGVGGRRLQREGRASATRGGVMRLAGGAAGGASSADGVFLLCTDLDDTLVGDTSALADFNSLWRRELAPRGCKLVFNTGRSLEDYKALRKDWELLVPDVFIGGCGTQMCTFDSAGNDVPVSAWAESLRAGWDKSLVATKIMSDAQLRAKYGEMQEKRESLGNELLFSMRLPGYTADVDAVREDMLSALGCNPDEVRINVASVSFAGATTVTGAAGTDVSGADGCLFVDVMPMAAGKGRALAYVREALFSMAASQCVVAGDSGNDVAMFEGDVARGIMVGNAKSELLAVRQPGHFVADASYAAGLLEGLRHYGLLDVS